MSSPGGGGGAGGRLGGECFIHRPSGAKTIFPLTVTGPLRVNVWEGFSVCWCQRGDDPVVSVEWEVNLEMARIESELKLVEF